MTTLTAILYPDDATDWLVAHNPETGTTRQGKTVEEALANLKESHGIVPLGIPTPKIEASDADQFRGAIHPCLNCPASPRRRGFLPMRRHAILASHQRACRTTDPLANLLHANQDH
jgi:hypothetical protein